MLILMKGQITSEVEQRPRLIMGSYRRTIVVVYGCEIFKGAVNSWKFQGVEEYHKAPWNRKSWEWGSNWEQNICWGVFFK